MEVGRNGPNGGCVHLRVVTESRPVSGPAPLLNLGRGTGGVRVRVKNGESVGKKNGTSVQCTEGLLNGQHSVAAQPRVARGCRYSQNLPDIQTEFLFIACIQQMKQ